MGDWKEEAKKALSFFGMPTGFGGQDRASSSMLKISPTNRFIVNDRQAKVLIVLKMYFDYIQRVQGSQNKRYNFLFDIYNQVQEFQLTVDAVSRSDFKDIEIMGKLKKLLAKGKKEGMAEAGDSEDEGDW